MTQQRHSFDPQGGFRELLFLFFPICLTTFSNCLYLFVEKVLLGRFSLHAMEAAVSAAYAIQVFQGPCVALAMMAQVFVGRWQGANEPKAIGPGMWQFIWFSFFSMFLTVPFGMYYGEVYFQGTDIGSVVFPYYYFLILINFLFPLGGALTCFYLGQGKTRLVLVGTLFFQVLKLVLAYLLIFGWGTWIPSLGILGGAISTCISQGGYSLLLFIVFLNSKNAELFDTRNFKFRPRLFWECIHPGMLRGLNRILTFLCWASIAYLMSGKGGDYLLILSIGGTIFIFLPFLGDAVCQAQTTVFSHLLGSGKHQLMDKAFWSGMKLALITVAMVSIPLIWFPSFTFQFLFSNINLDSLVVQKVFFGVWVSFLFYTLGFLPVSYILAQKDTKFSLFMGIINWFNGYLLMYFAVDIVKISPVQFWLTLSLMHASSALFYYWRMKWLQGKVASQVKEANV